MSQGDRFLQAISNALRAVDIEPPSDFSMHTLLRDLLSDDSLTNIEIITLIEDELDVDLPIDGIGDTTTAADLLSKTVQARLDALMAAN